jgi:hypothetical protein
MRQVVLIAALCTAVAVHACAATLSGVVRDATGHGIPNVLVIVRSAPAGNEIARARTDVGGAYSTSLPSGDFSIIISSSGFMTAIVSDVHLNEDGRSLRPVMLEIGNRCGSVPVPQFLRPLTDADDAGRINGTILDHSDHKPVANALITVRCEQNSSCGEVASDSNGQYRFLLKAGEYALHLRHPDYFEDEYAEYHSQIGYETVYYPVFLDRCKRGKCQPRRKPVPRCE